MTDTQPALTTAVEVAKTNAKHDPRKAIKQELEVYSRAISNGLPTSYDGGAERFARSVLNAIMTDKTGKLVTCAPRTIIGAALHAAQLGLEIGPLGEAYLVPFGNECTFMLGYRGMIKLAYQAGVDIDAQVVHQGDLFDVEWGTNQHLVHRPQFGPDRGRPYLWWALGKRVGAPDYGKFVVVDETYVAKRRAVSKMGNKGAWSEWTEEMALKTAIRALGKRVPMSTKGEVLQIASASDGAVRGREVAELEAAPSDFANDDDEYLEGEVVE